MAAKFAACSAMAATSLAGARRSLEPARLLTPAMAGGSTCTASRRHPRSQLGGKTPLEIRFGEADSMAVAFGGAADWREVRISVLYIEA